MKKIFSFICGLLFIFTACTKEEKSKDYQELIIGQWELVSEDEYRDNVLYDSVRPAEEGVILAPEFYKSGKTYERVKWLGSEERIYNGTWTIKDGKVWFGADSFFTMGYGYAVAYDINTLNKTSLVISIEDLYELEGVVIKYVFSFKKAVD